MNQPIIVLNCGARQLSLPLLVLMATILSGLAENLEIMMPELNTNQVATNEAHWKMPITNLHLK